MRLGFLWRSKRNRQSFINILEKNGFDATKPMNEKGIALYNAVIEIVKEYGPQTSDDIQYDIRAIYKGANINEPVASLIKSIVNPLKQKANINSTRADDALKKYKKEDVPRLIGIRKHSIIFYRNEDELKTFVDEMLEPITVYVYRSKQHPDMLEEEREIYKDWAL